MQNFRTLGQPLLGEKFVTRKRKKERKIIPLLIPNILLGPMGVLAPGSVHDLPYTWPPINTSGIFTAQMGVGHKY